MYRGTIFGREVRMSGSPLSMLVFKREFGGDFSDFVTSALKQCEGENPRPDALDFLQIAWTMARTYDEDVPDYTYWLNTFPDEAFDVRLSLECVPVVLEAIAQELLVIERPGKPTEKDEAATLPPEWQPYQLILTLKQLGFSLDEIRGMTMADVIAFTDIYYAANNPDEVLSRKAPKKVVREATEADIQWLLH